MDVEFFQAYIGEAFIYQNSQTQARDPGSHTRLALKACIRRVSSLRSPSS